MFKSGIKNWLKNVAEAISTRQNTAEKQSLQSVIEYSEPVFNAMTTTRAVFQPAVKGLITAVVLTSLSGCTSLMATATGSAPVGKAAGERTLSMTLEDSSIENSADINIYKADRQFREANVNVISFYSNVLLAGQVPTEELKTKAEKVVRDIAEVKQIHNELEVAPASYYAERISDGTATKRISSALLFEKGFPSSRTKVFTVGGTVYLMGKLTAAEADQAVTIIKGVSGVKKIVKLVDYLPSKAENTTKP